MQKIFYGFFLITFSVLPLFLSYDVRASTLSTPPKQPIAEDVVDLYDVKAVAIANVTIDARRSLSDLNVSQKRLCDEALKILEKEAEAKGIPVYGCNSPEAKEKNNNTLYLDIILAQFGPGAYFSKSDFWGLTLSAYAYRVNPRRSIAPEMQKFLFLPVYTEEERLNFNKYFSDIYTVTLKKLTEAFSMEK